MRFSRDNQDSIDTDLVQGMLSGFNPFPIKPWFLRVYSTSLLKTLWGKKEEIARNE